MELTTSKHVAACLVDLEGYEKRPYRDTRCCWTVGVGHKLTEPGDDLPPQHDRVWSEDEIDQHHADDLATAEDAARRNVSDLTSLLWEDLAPGQQAALVEMAYQLGGGRQRGFPRMWIAIRDGWWAAAAKEMLHSDWCQQTPVRAWRCALMMATGDLLHVDFKP